MLNFYFIAGFLTLPTAYVTGNPVECVLHPRLWNKTKFWDPLGVGHITQEREDEYEEENVGYPIGAVGKCARAILGNFMFFYAAKA
jgi:hypothetical protein